MIAQPSRQELVESHETAVVGSMLLDPNVFDHVTATISQRDFADEELAEFFGLIVDLHQLGKPINDCLLMLTQAKRRKLAITAARIAEVFSAVPDSTHAVYYAQEVAEASKMRRLGKLHGAIGDQMGSIGSTSDAILNLIDSEIKQIATATSIELDDGLAAIRKFEDRDESSIRVESGLPRMDADYGGFCGGELIVLGARLGTGKTALGWQFMMNALKRGQPCLFASLEMGTRELMMRHFAAECGIDPIKIRTDNLSESERNKIEIAKERFAEYPVSIFAPSSVTVRQLAAACRLKMSGGGLEMVLVDYFQLIRAPSRGKERRPELEEISRELKGMARELGVPVIALCQLNRAADDSIPRVSQIAESDSIGRDADQVLLLSRNRAEGTTELRIAKHRFVADDAVNPLIFNRGRFSEQSNGSDWAP